MTYINYSANNAIDELISLTKNYCRSKKCFAPREKPGAFCKRCVLIRENKNAKKIAERTKKALDESQKLLMSSDVDCIYFIQIKNKDKYIKIGKSLNVKNRLSGLQTSTPYSLEVLFVVPADPRYEALAHAKYKKHHVRGEWFKPHKDILDDIEYLKQDSDITIYEQ